MQNLNKSQKILIPLVMLVSIFLLGLISHYQRVNVIGDFLGDVGSGLVIASMLTFQVKTRLPEDSEETSKTTWIFLYVLMAAVFTGMFSLIRWLFE